MDTGELVSDKLILGLVKERVSAADCEHGYLLDGFPRNIPQAEGMQKAGIDIDYAVEIQVDDEEIIKRISGRRAHLASGRTYHIVFKPPQAAGKDDLTGEALVQRDDDKEETVKKRLQVYREQTTPLIAYYTAMSDQGKLKYLTFNGMFDMHQVAENIISALSDQPQVKTVNSDP